MEELNKILLKEETILWKRIENKDLTSFVRFSIFCEIICSIPLTIISLFFIILAANLNKTMEMYIFLTFYLSTELVF
jgi:hypothetical protein